MDQQLALMESLQQSLLPRYQPAPGERALAHPASLRHRHGCRKHLPPGTTAQAFSSPELLRDMAYSRLPPQLLAQLLAASSDAVSMPQAIFLGGSDPEERMFLGASAGSQPSAGAFSSFRGQASFGSGEQLFGSWEARASEGAAPSRLDQLPSWESFDSEGQASQGLVLFVLLCVACVVVWLRLAVLACAVRRASTKCPRARHGRCRLAARHGKGADLEEPLLEPLAPEAASLGILSNALYTAPRGKHHAPLGFHPYEVEVAADHADPSAPHSSVVTIQYVPLQSEKGASGP